MCRNGVQSFWLYIATGIRQPMAVAVFGGLITSTALSLLANK